MSSGYHFGLVPPLVHCLPTISAHLIVCKILGAGSEQNMGFQELVGLGRATSTHMASVCAALDHCHVPGRTGEWQIPEGRMEIGLGLHNETVSTLAEHPSPSRGALHLT
jgi:dihydroxyacetone kinase